MLADVKSEMILNEAIEAKPVAMKVSEDKTAKIIDPSNTVYPSNKVFNINDLKVIYTDAGSSLLALANNYNISLKKLLEYNDLPDENDILDKAQLIYLEKKIKKRHKRNSYRRGKRNTA